MDKGNCQTTFEKFCRKTYLWSTALLLFEFKTREELGKSLIVVSNRSTTFVFLSTLDNIALIAECEMASFLPFPWNSLHFSSEKKKRNLLPLVSLVIVRFLVSSNKLRLLVYERIFAGSANFGISPASAKFVLNLPSLYASGSYRHWNEQDSDMAKNRRPPWSKLSP